MTKLRGDPWAVLVMVSLGFFMTLLDKNILCAKMLVGVTAAHDAGEP